MIRVIEFERSIWEYKICLMMQQRRVGKQLRAMKANKMNDITLFLFSVNIVYIFNGRPGSRSRRQPRAGEIAISHHLRWTRCETRGGFHCTNFSSSHSQNTRTKYREWFVSSANLKHQICVWTATLSEYAEKNTVISIVISENVFHFLWENLQTKGEWL